MNISAIYEKARNPDPLTGVAGAHLIGTGLGAVTAGIFVAAGFGTIAGPAGAVVGAILGAFVGGAAGRDLAERFNPTRKCFGENRELRDFAKIPRVDDFRRT